MPAGSEALTRMRTENRWPTDPRLSGAPAENDERRVTPGRLPRSMIVSRPVISDDQVLLFLILGELSKQRFALVWRGGHGPFLGARRSLEFGELPEQRISLLRVERDLPLRSSAIGPGAQSSVL